ncbi:helix-turn-helix domain-containing protein [Croceicoccus marinus]|uniref:Replication protein A n=1 Tax=Croceicoccus marinus TaxID=450378 RepID=A0A1Z1FB03_9SPHN|nr:helix-turn-helix domain-containing protein [Croceicoccus marinus]ARU15906.1 replication protein A [Croceicoccus marinus]
MIDRRDRHAAWRKSYDINDPRAQVSTVHWKPSDTNKDAFKFFDVIKKAIWSYSDHIREAGKPLPICANAMKVYEALIRHMDFRTGRCDPSLDTLASTCKLSRRTVVRQLDVLRREQLIDWTRRTVKTGNAPGQGPQVRQTSNAYFIDIARLPIEILRMLRQKLGAGLREGPSRAPGSGGVPSRLAGRTARLVSSLAGSFVTNRDQSFAGLASRDHSDRLAHMYRGDPDGLRQHLEMLGLTAEPGASANLALYPSIRN